MRVFVWLPVLLFVSRIAYSEDVPFPAGSGMIAPLDGDSFGRWKKLIESEFQYGNNQSIPWETSFAAGLKTADKAGKPVLLWVMNGHPLGCT